MKTRPQLPKEYERIYQEHYLSNRNGISMRLESWMHRQVSKSALVEKTTLEIGAGTLNHLDYEFSRVYHIIEPLSFAYVYSPNLWKVDAEWKDISQVPPENKYDRIISIATLEHLTDVESLIVQAKSHLKPDGVFEVAIPNEGSLLWSLAWHLTTGILFRIKYGLDYGVLMRYEHPNTAKEIREVLGRHFQDIESRYFGISNSLSLYHFYSCKGTQ